MLPRIISDRACFVIFLDVTNPQGMDDTRRIFYDLNNLGQQNAIKIIVANKIDCDKRFFKQTDVFKLAEELGGVESHETSLKKNYGINQWLEPLISKSYEFQSKLPNQLNSETNAYQQFLIG